MMDASSKAIVASFDGPRGAIDTHTHLLPGLDDGSRSLEESLAMAREAARAGVHALVCTPHLLDTNEFVDGEVERAFELLDDALDRERLPLHLSLGYEVGFSFLAGKSAESLRGYAFGAGSHALLVEMPYRGWPLYAAEMLFDLRVHGFTPVLAHPERNDRIQRDPDLLRQLVASGAVAQGTCASLVGLFGSGAERTLIRHLEAGDISLLATDAHFDRPETWSFGPALRRLTQRLPEADLDLLVRENPRRLLAGEALLLPQPIERRSGALQRLARVWR
jgi:protein-tyrosine phosphatase